MWTCCDVPWPVGLSTHDARVRISLQVRLRVLLQLALVVRLLSTHGAHPAPFLSHNHITDPPVKLGIHFTLLRQVDLGRVWHQSSFCIEKALLHPELHLLLLCQGVDVLVLCDDERSIVGILQEIKIRQPCNLLFLRFSLDNICKRKWWSSMPMYPWISPAS